MPLTNERSKQKLNQKPRLGPRVRPERRPQRPWFSSGPCVKRPGWDVRVLRRALAGRYHRSKSGKTRLAELTQKLRAMLELPDGHQLVVVPGSDTAAFEAAMWNFLGYRPVDVFAWENFGATWVSDIVEQLKLTNVQTFSASYGELPDLHQASSDHDQVFCFNGTTSGVRVPDLDWIASDRHGLTLCDATSAVFAMKMDWSKLDVTTFSWQKALGGEAQHGVIVLSERAIDHLAKHPPLRALPKIFRLTKPRKGTSKAANGGQEVMSELFGGSTINTPSMLCVEDMIDALDWASRVGGPAALRARSSANAALIEHWLQTETRLEYLAREPNTRSTTSVCLAVKGPADRAARQVEEVAELLETEGAAFDIKGHRAAPPHLRLWTGCTVNTQDIRDLLPWLSWALDQTGE